MPREDKTPAQVSAVRKLAAQSRHDSLSPKRRSEIAREAARKRWLLAAKARLDAAD